MPPVTQKMQIHTNLTANSARCEGRKLIFEYLLPKLIAHESRICVCAWSRAAAFCSPGEIHFRGEAAPGAAFRQMACDFSLHYQTVMALFVLCALSASWLLVEHAQKASCWEKWLFSTILRIYACFLHNALLVLRDLVPPERKFRTFANKFWTLYHLFYIPSNFNNITKELSLIKTIFM